MDEDLITIIKSENRNGVQSHRSPTDEVANDDKSVVSNEAKSSGWILPAVLTSTLFLIVRKLLKSKK